MNEYDTYTIHKIGELLGIQQSEKSLNDKPTLSTLQGYINRFLEECRESKKEEFFLFVFCDTHSTLKRN